MVDLVEVMCEVFECDADDIDDDAEINEVPGWDSLSHVRLILALNAQGLDIPTAQIADLTSYASLKAFVAESGS